MSRSYKISIVLAVALAAGVFFYHHRHRDAVSPAQSGLVVPTGRQDVPAPIPVAPSGTPTGIGDLMSRIRSHMTGVDGIDPPALEPIAPAASQHGMAPSVTNEADASVGWEAASEAHDPPASRTLTFGPLPHTAPATDAAAGPDLTTARPEPDHPDSRTAAPVPTTGKDVSITPVADAAPPEPRTYTVQPGDTFSTIAVKIYGSEQHWIDIAATNPFIDPRRLRVGQEIRLPAPQDVLGDNAQAPLHAPGQTVTHIIRSGETLSGIAHRYYNAHERWREIFLVNRDTIGHDPDRLRAGDVLRIPPEHMPAR